MKRHATILLSSLFLLFLAAVPADAQDEPQQVTVRQINAIPADSVNKLQMQGANLDLQEAIADSTFINPDLNGELVTFTAVVLSDPHDSGLASVDDDGLPGRIHVFVRDTMAVHEGFEGMGIQIVDGNYSTTGLINVVPGDLIDITGTVSPFGGTMQVSPQSIDLAGTVASEGLPSSIMDPVASSTASINRQLSGGGVQIDWSNMEDVRGQYVRLENAVVLERDISSESRPNWAVTTDGGETAMMIYDTGIRYRNDRADYPDDFNKHPNETFIPPPIGSTVNLEGYVTFNDFEPFGFSVPSGAVMAISPMSAADLEVVSTPPVISELRTTEPVPGEGPVEVTAMIVPDEGTTVTSTSLSYYTSAAPEDTLEVSSTSNTNDQYTFEIAAQNDGAFVTFFVEAEDSQGADATSADEDFRVLFDGINEIEDIQLTTSGGFGDSPFAGSTVDMTIDVIVQSRLDTSGLIAVQDKADLASWSGIRVAGSGQLFTDWNRGDSVRITRATVIEDNDVTFLTDPTYEVLSEEEALPYKTVTTSLLQDGNVVEAHEGMMIFFDQPTITDPVPNDFGEWEFTTGEADEALLGDDLSEAVPESFAGENFEQGETIGFLQGVSHYSFGNFKLLPEDPAADVGATVAVEDGGTLPDRVTLGQNYPNPFTGSTTFEYTLNRVADVQVNVFDILGRQLHTLVNAKQSAGTYTVRFDASSLPSGVYFYRLHTGETTITEKMLHVK